MMDPKDIRSLTEFQRQTKAALQRLKKSGRPEVLTVNGKAAVIVQDADAYTRMIESMDRAHMIEAVRVGIEQMEAGKMRPWREVRRELQAKHGLGKRRRRSA